MTNHAALSYFLQILFAFAITLEMFRTFIPLFTAVWSWLLKTYIKVRPGACLLSEIRVTSMLLCIQVEVPLCEL